MKSKRYFTFTLLISLILSIPIVQSLTFNQENNILTQSIVNVPYYYVDNNSSNVDSGVDKGTHSNFTFQQNGPDSLFDNLTEENLGEYEVINNYVDNNLSDVDSSGDQGTHSNFTAQQYGPDSIYDSLLEDAAEENWFSGWQKRKKITIDYTKVEANLNDFPILINVTDTGLRDYAQSDGDDILFAASDGTTKLSHEIETFNGTTGQLITWVKTNVSATINTVLYLYYDNPSASNQENIQDVWSNGYVAVWHLNGDFQDSTSNNHDGTNIGSLDVAGKMANGREFNPDDGEDHLEFGDWNVTGNKITLQSWVKCDDFGQDDPRFITKAQSASAADHLFMLGLSGSGEKYLRARVRTGTTTTTLIAGTGGDLTANIWYLVAVTYDGDASPLNIKLLRNGVEPTVYSAGSQSRTGDLVQNTWPVWAGDNPNTAGYGETDGQLDELRISNIVRSEDWLKTEYNNQYNASSFYSIGSQEEQTSNYNLDLEVQWTDVDYNGTNGELCIYGGTMGSENIQVDAWNGSGWENLYVDLVLGWNNVTVTSFLTSSTFTVRFKGGTETGDTNQDQWKIDVTLIRVWNEPENYEVDLEVQWTNVDYSETNEDLCISGGTMGSENILVDAWNGSGWNNLFSDLNPGWNNVTVTSYLTSSTFTIRFKGETETGDTNQDSWAIDSTLLHVWS